MTDEGIVKCLAALNGAYITMYKNMTPNDWKIMKDTWKIQFSKLDDVTVFGALQEAISTSEFPPSIATIKKHIFKETEINEEEVWSRLLQAGRNGSYGSLEEWNKLPEDLKAITTPETIREIAMADDDAIQFIKKDILKNYHSHKNTTREKLITGSVDIKLLGEK